MPTRNLPRNTWLVVAQPSPQTQPTLVSEHRSQREAETECDRRNRDHAQPPYRACMVLEPIAQRMGGQLPPTANWRNVSWKQPRPK